MSDIKDTWILTQEYAGKQSRKSTIKPFIVY